MQRIINVISTFVLCMVLLIGFSGKAQAIRYNYYLNPGYDNAPIWYVDTTTTTATMTVGSKLWGDGWDYYSYETVVRCDKYLQPYWDDPYWFMRAGGGAHWGSPIPRQWSSKVLMTGLTPGTTYTLIDQASGASQFGLSNQSLSTLTITTEHNAPTNPTFTDITPNTVGVNWTKNGNGSATYYTLYRGASATGPWTQLFNGSGTFYADSGLVSNTQYYYRVGSYVAGQAERYATITPLTTSEDPAVAAAVAAKNSADLAMTASELAKTAALDARISTDNMAAKVTAMETQINTLLLDRTPPTITKFNYIIDKIRLTRSATPTYILDVTDDKSTVLQYRYSINNASYTEWTALSSNMININVGDSMGFKQIIVEVKDESGKIASAGASIFKW